MKEAMVYLDCPFSYTHVSLRASPFPQIISQVEGIILSKQLFHPKDKVEQVCSYFNKN